MSVEQATPPAVQRGNFPGMNCFIHVLLLVLDFSWGDISKRFLQTSDNINLLFDYAF